MRKRLFFYCILMVLLCSLAVIADELDEPSWVYKSRGDRFFRDGSYGKALAQYKKALIQKKYEGGAGYPEVNLRLAQIYQEEKLYDLALRQIELAEEHHEALQIPDLIYDFLYTKARIYAQLGKMGETVRVLNTIIEKDENWHEYKNQRLSKIPESFIEDFARDTTSRKKFGEAYFLLGELKYQNRNFETAEPYLKMALLYRYRENLAKELLEEYYSITGARADFDKVEQIAQMFR
jgi:tetratricopeptide (TPR) repeat protein